MLEKTNAKKTAFECVQIARHPARPYSLDIFENVFDDFLELHGDRRYAEDPALVCGLARLGDFEILVAGHQKGRDTKQRHRRNFGMPKPEGYRKALRLMQLANKFNRPVITFIDTPGAYPGIDAEERGQAEAIAFNLKEMAELRCPIVAVVIGEGGSGGALAIGVADRVLMMQNSIYSVISPEGCAAILWKDAARADLAAEKLKLTATDLQALGVIDEIIPEPKHWDYNLLGDRENQFTIDFKNALLKEINLLVSMPENQRMQLRYRKLRKYGFWHTL
ncbi:MAG TPA: acetyl-CoA carboxylase carboxyltransferase subunit alpha [Pyrinomonadaceae bacterium]